MIISKPNKFVFIHIQKTAGTSITERLRRYHGYDVGFQHATIKELPKEYNDFFKFCFVRNPWDRLLSWYMMFFNNQNTTNNDFGNYIRRKSKNFSQFLNSTDIIDETELGKKKSNKPYYKSITFNQLDYITNNEEKVDMDFIGRFENLQDDYNRLCEKIGVVKYNLRKINSTSHDDYRRYYNDKDIDKVYNMYKRDIDYFGYEF